MKIAMIGTRGVPARYGGFETAVEEIGARLASRGHEVLVFRRGSDGEEPLTSYRGMSLVTLPALRRRSLETLSHTALSVTNAALKGTDAAVLFNAANSPLLPVLRLHGIPVATHVDGLEWRRSKWGRLGRRYYRLAESLAVRWSDEIIADAQGIADYYAAEFSSGSRLISYGAPTIATLKSERLAEVGLNPRSYHLVVARFEPENHVLEIVKGFVASPCKHPLVVVGSAPYADAYTAAINEAADARVRLLGGVWDQDLLDQLYAHSATYLHGHSVGGTNPSLLRAAGAGAPVIAFDTVFNREVVGDDGWYFHDSRSVSQQVVRAEEHPQEAQEMGRRLQSASTRYNWDSVADSYETLCADLAARQTGAQRPSGRRNRPGWTDGPATEGGVIVAHPSPDLYGSDRMMLETVVGLAESGRNVVVTLPTEGPLIDAVSASGIRHALLDTPVLRKSILSPVGAARALVRSVVGLRPAIDLIRTTDSTTVLVNTVTIPLWIVAGKLAGARVVCHVHEAEASQPAALKMLMYAPLLLADHLVVNSKFSLDVMADAWPVLRRRAEVVYNGVAGPPEAPTPPRMHLDGEIRLLFIGRLSPRKGPDVAIDALAELRAQGLDVRLQLLGAVFPGYEWFERDLVSQAARLGVSDHVDFLGFRTDVWEVFDSSDLVVVPSVVDEPFGNTAVEAILAGRPLVVSETSGLKEAAADFAAVRFVPPGASSSLAEAVVELIRNWPQSVEQVAGDRHRAEEKFSIERYRQQMNAALLGG